STPPANEGGAGRRAPALGRTRARRRPARRATRREASGAHPHGVPAPGAAHAEPAESLAAQSDLRTRLGLRLRSVVERTARLHRVPAQEAGRAGVAKPDPERAGRGV